MNKMFPCICGHEKEIHNPNKWLRKQFTADNYMQDACYQISYQRDSLEDLCPCSGYKPDNLRWLEQKASMDNKGIIALPLLILWGISFVIITIGAMRADINKPENNSVEWNRGWHH